MLYFMLQYVVLKRKELLNYSLYLLVCLVYYFLFITSALFHLKFDEGLTRLFKCFEFGLGFASYYFYTVFLIYYLNIRKQNGKLYTLVIFYKNYNLLFTFVFMVLGILNIHTQSLFDIFSLFTLPLTVYSLVKIWKIKTVHSNVVILGTTIVVIGIFITMILVVLQNHHAVTLPFNLYTANQIAGLFDVFILGYGLSLKAAESDRQLVVILQENQRLLEVERSRVAKDLHDGLGGMLSGVKMTLSTIPGNVILSDTNAKVFTSAIHQLDKSITEMRRVAHSMMPEALIRFGLIEAVQDLFDGINDSKVMKTKLMTVGTVIPLSQSTSLTIYRIIQEVINNTIKHSKANNVLIQLAYQERNISVSIEDDGIGFDLKAPHFKYGAGIKNIQSRVNYLNGNVDLQSTPGIGTSVNIEIPIQHE